MYNHIHNFLQAAGYRLQGDQSPTERTACNALVHSILFLSFFFLNFHWNIKWNLRIKPELHRGNFRSSYPRKQTKQRKILPFQTTSNRPWAKYIHWKKPSSNAGWEAAFPLFTEVQPLVTLAPCCTHTRPRTWQWSPHSSTRHGFKPLVLHIFANGGRGSKHTSEGYV